MLPTYGGQVRANQQRASLASQLAALMGTRQAARPSGAEIAGQVSASPRMDAIFNALAARPEMAPVPQTAPTLAPPPTHDAQLYRQRSGGALDQVAALRGQGLAAPGGTSTYPRGLTRRMRPGGMAGGVGG